MELLPFLLLTTAGSLIWNTVLIGAGAVAGASWERILVLLKTYSRFAVMGAGILGFAVACVYFGNDNNRRVIIHAERVYSFK